MFSKKYNVPAKNHVNLIVIKNYSFLSMAETYTVLKTPYTKTLSIVYLMILTIGISRLEERYTYISSDSIKITSFQNDTSSVTQ